MSMKMQIKMEVQTSTKPPNLLNRTKTFSKNILQLCKLVKITYLNKNIIDHVLRSGTSIGANYCEACETTGKRDFANKIQISKREAKETVYWLELLVSTELDKPLLTSATQLIDESQQLVKIMGAIYDKSK